MNTELTLGGLFEGIGGFPLAAQWAGIKPIWSNEIDPYACKILRKNFKHKIIEDDIKNLGKHNLVPTDIISGGFPCQPFSTAGKRRGKEDNRYLWPQMFRIIQELKPTYVIGENVPGIITMENGKILDRIFSDLESEGYTVETFIIPACGVEAWHRRNRIWIVAYRDNSNTPRTNTTGSGLHRSKEQQQGETKLQHEQKRDSKGLGKNVSNTDDERSNAPRHGIKRERKARTSKGEDRSQSKLSRHSTNKDVSNTDAGFSERQEGEVQTGRNTTNTGCKDVSNTKSKQSTSNDNRQEQGKISHEKQSKSGRGYSRDVRSGYWTTEPDVGRVAHGVPNRVDRIKGLGNAIVPQIAYEIFMHIKQISK